MAKSIYALLGAALAVSLVAGPARAYDFQARDASLSVSSSAPFVRYTFEAEVVNRGGDSTLVGPTVEFEYRKSGGVWTEFLQPDTAEDESRGEAHFFERAFSVRRRDVSLSRLRHQRARRYGCREQLLLHRDDQDRKRPGLNREADGIVGPQTLAAMTWRELRTAAYRGPGRAGGVVDCRRIAS